MDKEQLDAIKERVAKATPGEWKWYSHGYETWLGSSSGGVITSKSYDDGDSTVEISDADAVFIAQARKDVPALVGEVERLKNFERKAVYAIAESRRLQALEGLSPILKTLAEGKSIIGQASARISFGDYDLVLEMLDSGEKSSDDILDEVFDWAEGLGLKNVVEKLESYATWDGGENDV